MVRIHIFVTILTKGNNFVVPCSRSPPHFQNGVYRNIKEFAPMGAIFYFSLRLTERLGRNGNDIVVFT